MMLLLYLSPVQSLDVSLVLTVGSVSSALMAPGTVNTGEKEIRGNQGVSSPIW